MFFSVIDNTDSGNDMAREGINVKLKVDGRLITEGDISMDPCYYGDS